MNYLYTFTIGAAFYMSQDEDDANGPFERDGVIPTLEKLPILSLTALHHMAKTFEQAAPLNPKIEDAAPFKWLVTPINLQALSSSSATIFSGTKAIEIKNPMQNPHKELTIGTGMTNMSEKSLHHPSSHPSPFLRSISDIADVKHPSDKLDETIRVNPTVDRGGRKH